MGESWPASSISASGIAVHAPGFMPGVLTTHSREMVTIPRVELGGIAGTVEVNWDGPRPLQQVVAADLA